MDKLEDRISIRLVRLEAHGFLHIKNYESEGYFDFWEKEKDHPGRDCDSISTILEQIPQKLDGEGSQSPYKGQVMARIFEDEASPEAYGIRVPEDYTGPVPEVMDLIQVEAGDYLIFEHGPFDYEKEGDEVYRLLFGAMDRFSYDHVDFAPDIRPGRVAYYAFDPTAYARYLLPVREKHQ